jgi:hypothetical protein
MLNRHEHNPKLFGEAADPRITIEIKLIAQNARMNFSVLERGGPVTRGRQCPHQADRNRGIGWTDLRELPQTFSSRPQLAGVLESTDQPLERNDDPVLEARTVLIRPTFKFD